MDPARFERVQRVFHEARRLEPADRPDFLNDACSGDSALREEVESLLQVDSTPGSGFMTEPALGENFISIKTSPRSEEQDTPIPETIGQYCILSELGKGGMGVVYEARQQKTGSVVALKVIRPGSASQGMLRRFEHEAQVLGRLRHPGIARIYEAGVYSADGAGVPFIAMERIEGPSLLDYVKRVSPDTRTVLKLFTMICDAVHHAHQKGVIHRDLKPGNILVEHTELSVQPKILDFGIARLTDADTLAITMQTHTGQLLGTVKYMSPEQAAGDPAEIDTRSDVYALGVILYELLARRMPYEVDRKLIHEAVRAIREDEARPLSSADSTYRGDLTTILGKALEKEKTRRYQSASELATDIRRYLNDEPITAHPPSAMYQLQKFARRNRGLVSGVAVVFVLLVSGIIATTWQAAVASRARDEAQAARMAEEQQRKRAERRLDEVHSLSRSLIFDFDDRIKRLAGATPAREFLVTRALEYLNSVAEDLDPDDMEMQLELSIAWFRLGDVQGDPRLPNLGDSEGALNSYLAGLQLAKAYADALPHEAGPRRSLGNAHNRVGELLMSMGRPDQAFEHYDRALDIFEDLRDVHPNDAEVLRALGASYSIQVAAHRAAGRFEDALQVGRKGMQILRSAAELGPDDDRTRHALAAMNSTVAEILALRGKPAEALTHRMECLTILESLAAGEPYNTVFRRDAGVAAERVGFSWQQAGDYEKALTYYHQAADIAEALIAADPSHDGVRFDLIRAVSRIGEAQLGKGRAAEAEETFRRHLELCRDYANGHPNDSGGRRQLGVAFYKVAEVHTAIAKNEPLSDQARQEHWRKAREWLRECRDVFVQMRDQGILATSDRTVPEQITAEIATCDAELTRLTTNDNP